MARPPPASFHQGAQPPGTRHLPRMGHTGQGTAGTGHLPILSWAPASPLWLVPQPRGVIWGGLQEKQCWREPIEASWVAQQQPQQGWRWWLLQHRQGPCVNRGCFVPAVPWPGGHKGRGLVSHPPVSHPLRVPHVARGKCQPSQGRREQNLSRGGTGGTVGCMQWECAPWHGAFLAGCHLQSIFRPSVTIRASPGHVPLSGHHRPDGDEDQEMGTRCLGQDSPVPPVFPTLQARFLRARYQPSAAPGAVGVVTWGRCQHRGLLALLSILPALRGAPGEPPPQLRSLEAASSGGHRGGHRERSRLSGCR